MNTERRAHKLIDLPRTAKEEIEQQAATIAELRAALAQIDYVASGHDEKDSNHLASCLRIQNLARAALAKGA